VLGLHKRLIRQLALDGIEDDRPVASWQWSKMRLNRLRELHPVRGLPGPTLPVWALSPGWRPFACCLKQGRRGREWRPEQAIGPARRGSMCDFYARHAQEMDAARAATAPETVAQALVEEAPAVGLGREHRLAGNTVAGAALVVEDIVAHLMAFPLEAAR
jgi:hypothetical protein